MQNVDIESPIVVIEKTMHSLGRLFSGVSPPAALSHLSSLLSSHRSLFGLWLGALPKVGCFYPTDLSTSLQVRGRNHPAQTPRAVPLTETRRTSIGQAGSADRLRRARRRRLYHQSRSRLRHSVSLFFRFVTDQIVMFSICKFDRKTFWGRISAWKMVF